MPTPPTFLGRLLSDYPADYSGFTFSPHKIKPNEYVGAEFEVEGSYLPSSLAYYWDTIMDHSLRAPVVAGGSCYEYVLKRPVSPEYFLNKALPYLKKKCTTGEARPIFSPRCSVHIHIGVHQLRMYQVLAMVSLFSVIEPCLFRLVGQHRHGYLFCVDGVESPTVPSIVRSIFDVRSASSVFTILKQPDFKYTSVNLRTLLKLGTVEFRMMEGNFDIERLSLWVKLLVRIRSYAYGLRPEQIGQLLNLMSASGPSSFLRQVVGKDIHDELLKLNGGKEELEKNLYKGIDINQSIFYEHDWENIKDIDTPLTKKEKKKPRVPIVPSDISLHSNSEIFASSPDLIIVDDPFNDDSPDDDPFNADSPEHVFLDTTEE